MAKSHHYCLSFLAILFSILTLHCSASSPSSDITSNQLKFWSENVQNQMPDSILQKLSPLTQKQSDYYTNILTTTNGKFTADANFCSLAKLACKSQITDSAIDKCYEETYKVYSASLMENKKHEDPFSFFRQSILRLGNLIHLPNLQESLPNRAFLPTQIASKIPLAFDPISKIFPNTPKETIQSALAPCNAASMKGETKSCPKSLEELVGFAKSALGETEVLALASKISHDSSSVAVIRKMKQYDPATKVVACHEVFLPFAAYFCHAIGSTRLYEVELVDAKNNEAVNTTLAICHLDTSAWPKGHVAFQILKFGPGEGEACHWFSKLDLAFFCLQHLLHRRRKPIFADPKSQSLN